MYVCLCVRACIYLLVNVDVCLVDLLCVCSFGCVFAWLCGWCVFVFVCACLILCLVGGRG